MATIIFLMDESLMSFFEKFIQEVWLLRLQGKLNKPYLQALEEFFLQYPEQAKEVLKICLTLYERTGEEVLPVKFVHRVLRKLDEGANTV